MNEVLEKIQKIGIVPVVVLDDAKDAAPLAKALCEGGLPCFIPGIFSGIRGAVTGSSCPPARLKNVVITLINLSGEWQVGTCTCHILLYLRKIL